MNVSILKPAIIFLAGAAAGGGAAYILTKRKYEAIVEEEFNSLYESAKRQKDEIEHAEKQLNIAISRLAENEVDFAKERSTYHKIIRDHGLKFYEVEVDDEEGTDEDWGDYPDPDEADAEYDPDDDYDDHPTEETGEVEAAMVNVKGYIITDEQFEKECLHYKKIEATHYIRGGHWVTDEGDDEVSEFFAPYMKDGTLKDFMADKEAELWMRFDGFEMDYHITHADRSFVGSNYSAKTG